MKILLFFDLWKGDFSSCYNFLKKIELKRAISLIKNFIDRNGIEVQLYCLNKDKTYLKKYGYLSSIEYVLNERLNINRKDYKKLIEFVWNRVSTFYDILISTPVISLNKFWKINESYIKYELINYFEKIEFIKSIIQRETPHYFFLMQDKNFLSKILTNELKFPKLNFYFLKSKIDLIFKRIHRFSNIIIKLYLSLKNFIKKKWRVKEEINEQISDKLIDIGIGIPNKNGINAILPIYKELNKQKIKVKIFGGEILNSFFQSNFNRFKLKLLTLIRIVLLWKNNKSKLNIIKYFQIPIKKFAFYYLKNFYTNNILKISYWYLKIKQEIITNSYKVILIVNEFGPLGKLICLICRKHNIPVYFTPLVGIVQIGPGVTPYFCDKINVYGILDKEYLISNGINPNKIVVRGSPQYEYTMQRSISKKSILVDHFTKKKFHISRKKMAILLTTNPISEESNKIILTAVINVLKKLDNNIQLFIKLHPRETGNLQKKILNSLNYEAPIIKNIDIFEIINMADLLLTQQSATILDSMVIGTPIICLDLMNKRVGYSGKHVYNDEKYIEKVYSEEELYKKLNIFIKNPEKLKEYKQKLRNNLKLFLYNEDNYSPTKKIVSDLKYLSKK